MAAQETDLQRFVREAARQAGLNLNPERLAAVTEQFARLSQQGELVMTFPLDDSEEPAAVFTP